MIDKTPVTAALFDEWSTIEQLLEAVGEAQWRLPTALPGWDVHAVVAHIIGTESFLSGVAPPPTDVDVDALPHVHNPIGALNERWVQGLRELSGAQMLARFRDITARRRDALAAMSHEEWTTESFSPLGPVPYGRFMRVRVFDCWMHELDIRDALGAPGDEGGTRGELAFLDIAEAIGFAVGKRGKAPDGSRVRIELTGPLARTIDISVDGRARVVDQLPDEPTSTIRLDSRLFVRLCGGRTSAAGHEDHIELIGDTEVGRRIVDNLAFVI